MRPSKIMRYLIGQKRCQVCQIFINWRGIWCPCCGYRSRTKPRNKKHKLALNKIKNKNNENKIYEIFQTENENFKN